MLHVHVNLLCSKKRRKDLFWEPYAVLSTQCKYTCKISAPEFPEDILLSIASCHVRNFLLKIFPLDKVVA